MEAPPIVTRLYLSVEGESWYLSPEAMEGIHYTLGRLLAIRGAGYTIKRSKVKIVPIRGAGGTKLCIETTWAHNLPLVALLNKVRALNGPQMWLNNGLVREAWLVVDIAELMP